MLTTLTAAVSGEPERVLPWDESVQLCKHLVDFDPILEMLTARHMIAFVDHDPTHVRGAVFTCYTVARFRCTAAVHGFQIRRPTDEPDKPFWSWLPFIQRFRNGRALFPSEGTIHHPSRGDDFVIVLAGNYGLRISIQHVVHFGTNIFQFFFRPENRENP